MLELGLPITNNSVAPFILRKVFLFLLVYSNEMMSNFMHISFDILYLPEVRWPWV